MNLIEFPLDAGLRYVLSPFFVTFFFMTTDGGKFYIMFLEMLDFLTVIAPGELEAIIFGPLT